MAPFLREGSASPIGLSNSKFLSSRVPSAFRYNPEVGKTGKYNVFQLLLEPNLRVAGISSPSAYFNLEVLRLMQMIYS